MLHHLTRSVGLFALVSMVSLTAEAADDPLQGKEVIVVSPTADVKLKEKVVGTVRLGEVFKVKHVNGSWLWIGNFEGWIKRTHVLPVDTAEAHFTQQIQRNPKTALTYEQRGVVRRTLKKYPQAIEDFGRAIELDKTAPTPLINRGHTWLLGGDARQAIDDFSLAIDLLDKKSEHPSLKLLALNNRSSAWAELKQYDKALADADAALKMVPQYPEALVNHGLAFQHLKKTEEALKDYSEAIKLSPNFALAYRNRGVLLAELERSEEALADLEKAVELDPTSYESHNDLAWLLATSKDEKFRNGEKAVTHAQTACQLSAYQSAVCLDTLAAAFAEAGQYDLALENVAKAIKLAPADKLEEIKGRQAEYQKAAAEKKE